MVFPFALVRATLIKELVPKPKNYVIFNILLFFCTGWPTADVLDKIMKGSFSLVPKLPKGVPIPERNIAWRYSFNNAEKVLFLDSEPGIANNCRRPVLRVLKGLRVDYKWPGIKSYHLKTIMLHEFESHHPCQWTNENLLPCLLNALRRLNVFLENKKCPHYFLPGINLFENITDEVSYTIRKDISLFLDNPEVALEKLLNNRVTGKSNAPFSLLHFIRKTEPILSVFALRSHCFFYGS